MTSAQATVARRRVAVVVQRYGEGFTGGAEAHARALARALATRHEVTVLTSCARDAGRWSCDWPAGTERIDDIAVERHAHPLRNAGGRARVPTPHKLRFLAAPLLDRLPGPRVPLPSGDDTADGLRFLQRQGPWCESLIARLAARPRAFDVAFFVTALYHPTAVGLPAWGRRSVLVPTLHDEKAMALPWHHRSFGSAGLTLFNTAAEARLAKRLYGDSVGPHRIVGVGVAAPAVAPDEVARVRAAHGLTGPYLLYLGRLETHKGVPELLRAWSALQGRTGEAQLVLAGSGPLAPAAPDPRLRATGFVSDADRDALLAGAAALVMPSRYESLSLVTLEAFAAGVPVLANADCEVLRDHLQASGAGLAWSGEGGLRQALLQALAWPDSERRRLGEAGRAHVARTARPEVVQAAWLDAAETVVPEPDTP